MVNKKRRAILQQVLSGTSDANIAFSDLTYLLVNLAFSQRVKGGHHIFWKDGILEIINLQPKGAKARPYQVRQVRDIVLRYKLEFADE